MNCKSRVVLLCVLTVVSNQGALADGEDNSEEVERGEETTSPFNDGTSLEAGAPDSHEAMNNREINLSTRVKRSYEFLMGLVNNNSKYEVTRMDSTKKLLKSSREDDPNAAASEILLELMVKIAAHPDHWNKVHNLLENIDNDLLTSKKIVDDLQNAKIKTEAKSPIVSIEKKESGIIKNKTEHYVINNEWPAFQDEMEMNRKENFGNTVSPEDYSLENDQNIINYPKIFTYHRVTGRPMFLNKNPKAYIAVSVIAPKSIVARSKNEDLILEKELRQLKPWTHNQNLKNMASIRSRWIIQRDEDIKETNAH